MKGDAPYWYDFNEFNLDGIYISLGTHAQQGTTFTTQTMLYLYIFHGCFTYLERSIFFLVGAVTCYYKEIDSRILLRLFFMKRDFYGQENPERYVTAMVGIFQFVTKRYIW